MNGRERVFAQLAGKPADSLSCLPITMMFAADHIGARYLDYATNYKMQVEGQLRVAYDYDFDYVNTMSDPAVEAADCGADIAYFPDQPPAINELNALLADKAKLIRLKRPDAHGGGRMTNRLAALRLFKDRVGGEKVIEGWVEGPCAEGADLRGINTLMTDFIDDPGFVRDLFTFIIEMEIEFARDQVAAGADTIGIGDAAASLVGPRIYDDFVFPFEKLLVDGIHALGVPVRLHICGNTSRSLKKIGQLGCDVVDVDYLVPIDRARMEMGPNQMLTGNIDPVRIVRNSDPHTIVAALSECHNQCGARFMVAPGCEIPRDTKPENVRALVEFARSRIGLPGMSTPP